jgi:hypothetical protein
MNIYLLDDDIEIDGIVSFVGPNGVDVRPVRLEDAVLDDDPDSPTCGLYVRSWVELVGEEDA